MAVKLGDANQDWADSSEAQTTLGARDALQVSDIIRLNAPQTHADGSITIDVHAQATQGLVGMQFGLNWDGQVLRLEGIENHQLLASASRPTTTSEKEALSCVDNACSVTSTLMATSQ